jgi:hypothetical protein
MIGMDAYFSAKRLKRINENKEFLTGLDIDVKNWISCEFVDSFATQNELKKKKKVSL